MAKVVLVVGCSHSTFLYTPPKTWNEIRERRALSPSVPRDSEEINQEKYRRCMEAFSILKRKIELVRPDVLLIFGYQSPTRFYYVHLSKRTDGVHNGVFLVHDADRKRLDEPTSVARLVDQSWHRVRIARETSNGRIRVFFDGDTTPALSATDATLTSGRVGVGSFDETAEFRALTLKP